MNTLGLRIRENRGISRPRRQILTAGADSVARPAFFFAWRGVRLPRTIWPKTASTRRAAVNLAAKCRVLPGGLTTLAVGRRRPGSDQRPKSFSESHLSCRAGLARQLQLRGGRARHSPQIWQSRIQRPLAGDRDFGRNRNSYELLEANQRWRKRKLTRSPRPRARRPR